MKKFVLTLCSILIALVSYAQTSIDNSGFEEWNSDPNFDYEEPGPPWATANNIATLAPTAPVSTFKETEKVVAGNYAAKMVTSQFQLGNTGLLVTGTIATGEFKPDLLNFINSLRLGIPFTDKPTCFSGYYMFEPVGDDSCAVYMQLTKYNTTTAKRDTVAEAWVTTGDAVSEYTYFSIPVEYYSQETPDTIIIVAASSARGWEFIGEVGTTLYVDELSIGYGDASCAVNVPVFPEIQVNVYPNPATDYLQIGYNQAIENGVLSIFDITGKLCQEIMLPSNSQQHTINIGQLSAGQYLYQLKDGEWIVDGGKFEVAQ